MLKINEFAKICGVSVHTLRYYDKCQILCPRETDQYSGYRYYDPEQKKDAETILTLKDLGFSLEEIKTYMNGSIQIRRLLLGRKKKDIEYHIHCAREQIKTIHALCGQDILSLSAETIRKVKSRFEDDPDVIGRWDYCGYLPPDAEFSGEENLLQDNYDTSSLFFLPNGQDYWVYFWSRGILYHENSTTNLLIPNPYEIIEYNGVTYLRLYWLSESIIYPDGKESIRMYRKMDSNRYDAQDAVMFSDKTDLPFVPDPRLVGTWDVYTFVYKPEDFDPRRQPTSRMKGMFDRIRCTEDGALFMRMRSSVGYIEMEHHYTNGYFLNDYDHFAEHYEYREHKGTDYLISEYKTGDYSYGGKVEIYCVLRRISDTTEGGNDE